MKTSTRLLGLAAITIVVMASGCSEPAAPATPDVTDHESPALTRRAWLAITDGDLGAALAYANACIDIHAAKAREMQASLNEYPIGTREQIYSYGALNDVGTSYFIRGEALRLSGQASEASLAFREVVGSYAYSQCWHPGGWFWRPAEVARQRIAQLGHTSE